MRDRPMGWPDRPASGIARERMVQPLGGWGATVARAAPTFLLRQAFRSIAAVSGTATARSEATLVRATVRPLFDEPELRDTAGRLAALRSRLAAAPEPDLAVVGSAAHRALAREVAERSITLVRDDDGILPLRLEPGARILTIMPRPRELTPADTSASVAPGLAAALFCAIPFRGRLPVDVPGVAARGHGLGIAARGHGLTGVAT